MKRMAWHQPLIHHHIVEERNFRLEILTLLDTHDTPIKGLRRSQSLKVVLRKCILKKKLTDNSFRTTSAETKLAFICVWVVGHFPPTIDTGAEQAKVKKGPNCREYHLVHNGHASFLSGVQQATW